MADFPLKMLLGEPMRVNRTHAQMNQREPPLRLLSLGKKTSLNFCPPNVRVFNFFLIFLMLMSIDGGGVRGYSMIIILQELMLKLFVEMHGRAPKLEEIPKPCDHFDLIGGTGTGGYVLYACYNKKNLKKK